MSVRLDIVAYGVLKLTSLGLFAAGDGQMSGNDFCRASAGLGGWLMANAGVFAPLGLDCQIDHYRLACEGMACIEFFAQRLHRLVDV